MRRLLVLAACLSLCTTALAEFNIEVGPTFLSGEFSSGGMMLFTERLSPKWEIGIVYASEQVCRCNWPADLEENFGIFGERLLTIKRFELGIGASYWNNTNRAFGKNFNFSGMLGWKLTDRLTFRVRHWSNVGSGKPNLGQDGLTLNWRFGDG